MGARVWCGVWGGEELRIRPGWGCLGRTVRRFLDTDGNDMMAAEVSWIFGTWVLGLVLSGPI